MKNIKVFKNNFDYVDFITSHHLINNEIICSSFIPSAFFPKDILDYFFDKKEHVENHKIVSDKLWNYGKQILKGLEEKKITVGIELESFKNFVESGKVHKATPNFEASLAIRINVINNILKCYDNIYFLPEPTSYIFRLIPDKTVILDVDRNKAAQMIQGIIIEDEQVYIDFRNEFERLKSNCLAIVDRISFKKLLLETQSKLKSGEKTIFDI